MLAADVLVFGPPQPGTGAPLSDGHHPLPWWECEAHGVRWCGGWLCWLCGQPEISRGSWLDPPRRADERVSA